MKLEPSHLIPYLLQNVECSYLAYKTEKRRVKSIFTGLSKVDGIETTYIREKDSILGDYIKFTGKNNTEDLQFKLHLHPLDLTKEIEHNGKKFIPLLELANICFASLNTQHRFVVVKNYIDMGHEYAFLYKEEHKSFVCYTEYNGKSYGYACVVTDQYEMFQKLFEWHIDMFGLIEADLAIEKK